MSDVVEGARVGVDAHAVVSWGDTAVTARASLTPARTRVGAWMRLVRARQHLTLKEVAVGCGVARVTVYTWEAGDRMPGVLLFIAWCRAVFIEPAQAISTVEILTEDADA